MVEKLVHRLEMRSAEQKNERKLATVAVDYGRLHNFM